MAETRRWDVLVFGQRFNNFMLTLEPKTDCTISQWLWSGPRRGASNWVGVEPKFGAWSPLGSSLLTLGRATVCRGLCCQSAMTHLAMCHGHLSGDVPQHGLLDNALAFHQSLAGLHTINQKRWQLRPKLHLFLELCAEAGLPVVPGTTGRSPSVGRWVARAIVEGAWLAPLRWAECTHQVLLQGGTAQVCSLIERCWRLYIGERMAYSINDLGLLLERVVVVVTLSGVFFHACPPACCLLARVWMDDDHPMHHLWNPSPRPQGGACYSYIYIYTYSHILYIYICCRPW